MVVLLFVRLCVCLSVSQTTEAGREVPLHKQREVSHWTGDNAPTGHADSQAQAHILQRVRLLAPGNM